jgi:dienelactone hydrolase
MTRLIRYIFLISLIVQVPFASPQSAELESVARIFDYDSNAPLDLQEKSVEKRNGVELHDVSFASPQGGRVSAYLVVPPGKGPFAGIVFLHSGQWDRHEFLSDAFLLASAGAVSVLIDAPPMRPKEFQKKQEDRLQGYVQLVVDCRRAVDLLLSRKDVDPKRIAYVGHSLGATWGGALAVSERRLKALVLMAGFSEFSASARKEIPAVVLEKAEPFLKAVAPLDADRLLPYAAPAAILFQFADFDQYISRDDAEKSIQAASDPKTVKWYLCGHEFSDVRALPDRGEFLHKVIGTAPLRPIILEDLGSDKKR